VANHRERPASRDTAPRISCRLCTSCQAASWRRRSGTECASMYGNQRAGGHVEWLPAKRPAVPQQLRKAYGISDHQHLQAVLGPLTRRVPPAGASWPGHRRYRGQGRGVLGHRAVLEAPAASQPGQRPSDRPHLPRPPLPPYWHCDAHPAALLVLSRMGEAYDTRTSDALDELERRRLPDSRWQAGGYWWKRRQTSLSGRTYPRRQWPERAPHTGSPLVIEAAGITLGHRPGRSLSLLNP
jgi:hypothetical protein